MRGLQCHKSLYLYKNFIKLRDALSEEQKALFSRGSDIGLLARQLFPSGTDATPPGRMNLAAHAQHTGELLAAGTETIYEAAFIHNDVLAIIDILAKREGKWYGYEVKSATKVSSTYIMDASIQYYVIGGAGIALQDISIVNINNQYIRKGALEPQKLFAINSVKEEAEKNREMIEKKIEELKGVLAGAGVPQVEIGEQCFYPYNCDFMGHCWKGIPEDSIFEMGGMNRKKQFELYHQGIKSIYDLPAPDKELERTINGEKVYIQGKELEAFVSSLRYPLLCLDFETYMPAVPVYQDTKAYQHIPFQYSLHSLQKPGERPVHLQFLAEAGADPRKEFLTNLLRDTEGEGDILVYNAVFERSVMNTLKKEFPEHGTAVDQRIARIKDLMKPFEEKMYYHPRMKGSYSIKNVLPALVPELSYNQLNIGSGRFAMAAFERLQTESDMFKIQETREALLSYCKMDTFAMVKLLEALEQAIAA